MNATSLQPRAKCSEISKEWISILPDDVLVSILSRLTMKEAARTSILASRWKKLWTFTNSLDFDDDMPKLKDDNSRFVSWVDNILALHNGYPLDEFRVSHYFTYHGQSMFKSHLFSWIKYAFEKKAKRIQFDLACSTGGTTYHMIFAIFPEAHQSCLLTTQFLCNYSLDHLTVVRLSSVNLTAEVLEHLLSRCPHLEVLSVANAISLLHVKVFGTGLKLKCLEILRCFALTSIELSAANLVSFKYHGPWLTIFWKGVPCLVEAYFQGPYAIHLIRNIWKCSHCLIQLETLTVNINLDEFGCKVPKFPKLKNLKQLKLVIRIKHGHNPSEWMTILKACPMLHKFTLELEGITRGINEGNQLTEIQPHRCLKIFEFIGFLPYEIDENLACYVLNNTLALKKMVIHPHVPLNTEDSNLKNQAIERAQNLRGRLPAGTELVIL